MANFSVTPNLAHYRATTHPFKLGLSEYTIIKEVDETLPLYSYSFMSLDAILKIRTKADVEHLIGMYVVFGFSSDGTIFVMWKLTLSYILDVIAFVKSISKIETYTRDGEEKSKLRLIISDDMLVVVLHFDGGCLDSICIISMRRY